MSSFGAYELVLYGHSYVRWVVLGLGIWTLGASLAARIRRQPWTTQSERRSRALVAAVDTQLTLGLALYFIWSPLPRAFWGSVATNIHDHVLRFFGLEHAVMMLLAVATIHIGRVAGKRAASAHARHGRVAATTAAALLIMASSIPWPGLRHGRPLLRGVGAAVDATTAGSPRRACPAMFENRCAACHGAEGRGDGTTAASLIPRPRNFTDAEWRRDRTDAALAAVIREGGAAHGLSAAMPANPDLSEGEIDALVRCVRSFPAAP